MSAIQKLPDVKEIWGIALAPSTTPNSPDARWSLQYADQQNKLCEFEIPLRQGLYLLGLLQVAAHENSLLPIFLPPKPGA